MSIRVICLGKTTQKWISQGLEEYLKRLKPVWKIQWLELKDVSLKQAGGIDKVKSSEAALIEKTLTGNEIIIALDENGICLDSVSFSNELQKYLNSAKDIVFIIGGVYGLDKSILNKADMRLSFSAFTFTHQMIRLLLVEQLYRCWTIKAGKSYHY